MIIGAHVSFGSEQLLGSVKEALSYDANTFMFYTGAPQNTIRKNIDENLTRQAHELMQKNNIDIKNVICHAPYIINLANNKDEVKYNFSINFLKNEISRCAKLGISYIVLHPGSSVGLDVQEALDNVIYALNIVLNNDYDVKILLETMAGKGTELASTLEELKYIIDHISNQEKIGVCLDSCHLNDAGYDMSAFAQFLTKFDQLIGLKYIGAVHLNDSKNPIASHKDRHENIGFGTIGFNNLLAILNNEQLKNVPKILETPYIGETPLDKARIYPPYKFEIAMLKSGNFNSELLSDIKNYYHK